MSVRGITLEATGNTGFGFRPSNKTPMGNHKNGPDENQKRPKENMQELYSFDWAKGQVKAKTKHKAANHKGYTADKPPFWLRRIMQTFQVLPELILQSLLGLGNQTGLGSCLGGVRVQLHRLGKAALAKYPT